MNIRSVGMPSLHRGLQFGKFDACFPDAIMTVHRNDELELPLDFIDTKSCVVSCSYMPAGTDNSGAVNHTKTRTHSNLNEKNLELCEAIVMMLTWLSVCCWFDIKRDFVV